MHVRYTIMQMITLLVSGIMTLMTLKLMTLKLQLSTYNSFFTGEIQEDACECLMLLIEIMDKGFGPCPTNDNINSKGSFF